MADKKTSRGDIRATSEPGNGRSQVSRRMLLVTSMAVPGALAVPTLAAAELDGLPPGQVDHYSDDVWFEAWEWKVRDHPGAALPLVVTEGTNSDVTTDKKV